MKRLLNNLRGVVVFGAMTVNTIFWFVPVMLFAVIKLVLPVAVVRRAITRALMRMGQVWVSTNTLVLNAGADIDWSSSGMETLRRDGWYLVISNHQTWVDIVVLQEVFNRSVPFLKFFIKQQLIWFPFLGLAWWALDMPFMKRYSPSYLAKNPHMKGKDLETTRRACKKFQDTPTSVLNFIEGTRFSHEKRDARQSPYENLLRPRAGGFAMALSSMGELFSGILDVTIVYPDGAVSFWDMCCGKKAYAKVTVEERPIEGWMLDGDYTGDREFRKELHLWLGKVWRDKDAKLNSMRESPHG